MLQRLQLYAQRMPESFFFIGYALSLLIHYPLNAPLAVSLVFYAMALPGALVYAIAEPFRLKSVNTTTAAKLFLLLFAYIVIHTLVLTADRHGLGKTLLNTVMTALFFLSSLLFFTYAERAWLHWFFGLLCIIAATSALASIVLFAVSPPVPDNRLIPIGRAHHEILGALSYGIAGLVALYMLQHSDRRSAKLAYGLMLMVISWMIVLTRSRMPIGAYAFCLILGGCYYFKPKRLMALAGAAAFLLLMLMLIPDIREYFTNYLQVAFAKGDGLRFGIWAVTWEHILQHPWVGNGMRALLEHDIAYSPHNIYLATVYYLGIPAGLLFLAAILCCLHNAIRLLTTRDPLSVMAVLLLLQGLISAMTEHGQLVKSPGPLWLILWMPVAFVLAQHARSRL